MATGPRYKVAFRRRREGRTNYHQRLKLILSKQNRVVARKSSKHMQIQLVKAHSNGDTTLCTATSTQLKKYGYEGSTGNTPAAYLTGLLFGYKAQEEGYTDGILDIGLQASSKGSRVYASLKGIVDSGFDIPHSSEIFPSDERIRGEHIQGSDLSDQVEAAKEKIVSEFS
ncbi:50S ribosomal protein L18 [Methanosalsum natronophilum]|uniref:Large ribosomal subunit protein uL18 n=1 Tax=Methanosalsum natronophilum TaxID=768733 RepID=A0A424YRZ0_9EURY|nr:50S ribosomal protein L18 [Methanosalsum natronophilum]MCS3924759.1 large subunit ribosomal protein L18 [Methanosalsum natronophilum]RQD81795.1 MAG: 50S ribosomal protein L18 [Methanosalsum natronophilum]